MRHRGLAHELTHDEDHAAYPLSLQAKIPVPASGLLVWRTLSHTAQYVGRYLCRAKNRTWPFDFDTLGKPTAKVTLTSRRETDRFMRLRLRTVSCTLTYVTTRGGRSSVLKSAADLA
jgi:hypothetical protein